MRFAALLLHLCSAHTRDIPTDTCMAGPPLPPFVDTLNNATQAHARMLISGAELKVLLRTGGPVLALFLQRRCPLSRSFWPAFVATSERFPHVRFVAVDVEFEFSLNSQLGISAVPHVRRFLHFCRPCLPYSCAEPLFSPIPRCFAYPSARAEADTVSCCRSMSLMQVIFATALGSDARSGQLHVRVFPVTLELATAEQRLAAFVQLHSAQLPLELDPARQRRLQTLGSPAQVAAHWAAPFERSWASLGQSWERSRANVAEALSHGALAAAEAPAGGSTSPDDEFAGFPEPPAIHWRLLVSVLVLLGWAVQTIVDQLAPCAPRVRELIRHGLTAVLRRDGV